MSIIFDFRQIRERCEALGFDYIVPDEEPEWQRETIVQVKLPELDSFLEEFGIAPFYLRGEFQ